MYRKYSSSTKSSRNERLAQLSEQESVIERKKKEILAKIEAQKKKETEEALKKLEPSHTNKRDNLHSYKKHSWNREKEVDHEEETIVCPRNAFSNDGSFLDQFKKLSGAGLDPKSVGVTFSKVTKHDEELNKTRKLGKEDSEGDRGEKGITTQTGNRERLEYDDQQKDPKSFDSQRLPNSKLQDSNIQLQLPPPSVVQLVPQTQVPVVGSSVTTTSKPYSQSMTNNPVAVEPVSLHTVTGSSMESKTTVSPKSIVEPQNEVPYQSSSHYQSTLSENSAKNTSCLSGITPVSSSVSVASIEPPLPMVPQNIPPPTPIQVHNIPPPPTMPYSLGDFQRKQKGRVSSSQEKYESREVDDEEKTDVYGESNEKNLKDKEFSVPVHSINPSLVSDISMQRVSSLGDTKSTRTLTVDEAGNGQVSRKSFVEKADSHYGKDAENSTSFRDADKGTRSHSLVKHINECSPHEQSTNYESVRQSQEVEGYSKTNRARDGDTYSDEEGVERKRKKASSEYDSSDSDTNSKDSYQSNCKISRNVVHSDTSKSVAYRDGYQADCEDEANSCKTLQQRHKKISFHKSSSDDSFRTGKEAEQNKRKEGEKLDAGENSASTDKPKRKKKSRWGDEVVPANSSSTGTNLGVQLPANILPLASAPAGKAPLLSKLTRSDPGLLQYARQTFGSTNLSEEDWKKAEDHYKINLLYQDMVKKRAEIDRLEKAGKFKYEYDSDEDVEGGTWEHKLRQQEMMATQLWAEELTRQAAGKHHIGDFLPPEELERFMEKYNAVKQGRKPDLSDYKEFKLKEDNVGYRLLQKMGWNEGQGLGQDGTGITNPVNKATTRHENQGLGVDRPDGLQAGDDEYDAYRKRMMLAYRFRPNPLNNPRRPYY